MNGLYLFFCLSVHPSMLLLSILTSSLADVCFVVSQASSPACTELETVVLDWLGKMLNLPEEFLAGSDGKGGGVIQVSSRNFNYTV